VKQCAQSDQLYYFVTSYMSPISVNMFTEIESQLWSWVPHCTLVKHFCCHAGEPENESNWVLWCYFMTFQALLWLSNDAVTTFVVGQISFNW